MSSAKNWLLGEAAIMGEMRKTVVISVVLPTYVFGKALIKTTFWLFVYDLSIFSVLYTACCLDKESFCFYVQKKQLYF
jgi:hypothetical protein